MSGTARGTQPSGSIQELLCKNLSKSRYPNTACPQEVGTKSLPAYLRILNKKELTAYEIYFVKKC
jgi:hypothetical protein